MRVQNRLVRGVALAAWLLSPMYGQAPSQPAPVKPTGGSPAYRQAGQLPARIMDFKVEPASVQPGQPVMLQWATENPTGVSIEPGLGRVTPRGSRQVSPAATTTYTLTANGPNNQVITRSVTVNVAGTTAVLAGAAPAKQQAPRMANGKPDFTGVYDFTFRGPGGPAAPAGGAPGGPALKPGAEKYRVVRGPTDSWATSNCMPVIGPQSFSVPYQFQVVVNPQYLVIMHEYPGTFRIVPLDGRPHQVDPDPTWLGDSVGRWDGDTVVVDTIGFNEKTELQGFRHTEALHIVERFSRPDFDALNYEVTLEDPNVFEKPWTVSRRFSLRPDLARISEFVCEKNPDYSKYFGKQ